MYRYGFVLALVFTLGGLTGPAIAQTPVFKIEDQTGTALLLVNDDGSITMPTGATNGYVLTTDANGNATWMPATGFALPFQGTHSSAGDAFKVTVDNTAAGSAGVFENTNAGNGEAPLVARTNSLVGTAARFEGDVEITDNLSCTGCIEASDVDPFGGIYASKQAIYINTISEAVGGSACDQAQVLCNDANDLPLQGFCHGNGVDMNVEWEIPLAWNSLTEPAGYFCKACNNENIQFSFEVSIVCLDVN